MKECVITIFLSLFFTTVSFSQNQITTVELDEKMILCDKFMGFGVEWDTPGYVDNDVTNEDFELIKKRVEWMRFPVVRIMIQSKWCYQGNGKYDWNSREMMLLYRNLDLCEKLGITVFLTEWGCEPSWLKVPDVDAVDDLLYAEIIRNYLSYLIYQKGYACIKYFIFGNEPNIEVKNWDRWKRGILNVYDELKKYNLLNKITLCGSGHSNGDDWHYKTIDQLQSVLGAYDFHYYHCINCSKKKDVYTYFKESWDYVSNNDLNSKEKPRVITEAGIIKSNDGYTSSHNSLSNTPFYGILMADYACKAIEAGSWSVMAWMLDDNSQYNFDNGMWANKASGFLLKPYFYSWSLLCRYFRPYQAILKTNIYHGDDEVKKIKCLAAYGRDMNTNKKNWSICFINPFDSLQTINLKINNVDTITMSKYIIDSNHLSYSGEGLPAM